jgi:transcriptional regulator with XRE-family HTH domain
MVPVPRKPVSDRGPVAAWLITSRRSRGWTAEQFLEEFERATGYAPTRPNYARWESGAAHPSEESMARLAAFWKETPDERVAEPTDPIVQAIRDQTAAIDRQTAALEALFALSQSQRTSDQARIEGLERAVLALGQSLRREQATEAPLAPLAPRRSAR